MERYDVRGAKNSWLKSYLDDRQQFVQIGQSSLCA